MDIKKIILVGICMLFLLIGCTSNYQDCYNKCVKIEIDINQSNNIIKTDCLAWNYFCVSDKYNPNIDTRVKCHNDCKP